MNILKSFKFVLLFLFLSCSSPIFSVPDLTIIGFFEPEGGIGKVPITILETLGENVSTNFIATGLQFPLKHEVPSVVIRAMNNSDESPGKVALLTDLIWDYGRSPANQIPKGCIVKLAYSMLETSRIPSMWVKTLNDEFDAVVVPDQFLVSVYEESGVRIPIFVLPLPMMLNPFYSHPVHPYSQSVPFVFGDASANKNPAVLIHAFAKAFGNSSDVHLVMRAGHLSEETITKANDLISQYGLTNVTLEEGHILIQEYIDRLSSFDCYVNLSRGEGFSFIPREALALGIPAIITNNTASITICDSGFVRAVPSNKRGPANPAYTSLFKDNCGEQFDCEVDDVIIALRDVYEHYEDFINKARAGREWVDQYNCTNPNLQNLYLTLIKPKQIIFGKENTIEGNLITTNSMQLYKKYKQIMYSKK